MSRRRRAISGFLADNAWHAVITIANFVVTPLILGLVSTESFGYWLTVLSVVSYLGLVDFGLGVALTRAVSVATLSEGTNYANRLISTAFFFFALIGICFLGCAALIAAYTPGWFGITQADGAELTSVFLLVIFAGALGLPLSTFLSFVIGLQHQAIAHTVRNVIALLALGVSLGLLYTGHGLRSLALGYVFEIVGGGAVFYLLLKKSLFPALDLRWRHVNRRALNELAGFGGYFQLGKLANTVAVSADNLIIAARLGAAAVAPYALTAKLSIFLSQALATKLAGALLPGLSQLIASGNKQRVTEVVLIAARYATRVAVLGAVIVFLVNEAFVRNWVGGQYFGGGTLTAVFTGWVLLDSFYRGIGVVLYAFADLKYWAYASVGEAMLNLALSLMLVGPYGLVGVALGTLIPRALTGVVVVLLIARLIGMPLWRFVSEALMRPALASLPGLAITVAVATQLDQGGWSMVITVATLALLLNVLSFEGLRLLRTSHLPWRTRLLELLNS